MQGAFQFILPILLFLTSIFLILLVLVQRGRGGGLAGAFGGLGGQSAFGTKAGDLFTRVTIFVAAFWIILCAASVKLLNDTGSSIIDQSLGSSAAPQQPGGAAPQPSSTPAKEASPETEADPEGTATDTESSAPVEDAAPESDK